MENEKVIAELLQRIKTLESRCDRYEKRSPLRYTVYLPQIRAQPLKSTWKNSKGKTGTQTVSKDYPRPGFLMGAVLKCYAVERRF